MGCEMSTQVAEPVNIGKTERRPRTELLSATSGNQKNSPKLIQRGPEQAMTSSIGSNAATSTVSLEVDEEVTQRLPKLDHNGNLLPEEVVRRTSSSLSVSQICVGNKNKVGKNVDISYAFRSQRGYYPDEPKKSNQDKYGITLNFAGEHGDAMFAVYDGHGANGHDAAIFAKKKLPQILAKHVRQQRVQKYQAQLKSEGKPTRGSWNPDQWPFLETGELESCCRKAFLETNKAMHDEKSFNDRMCGTTAASVVFHGGKMTVCNVGDSRVLLGHRVQIDSTRDPSIEEEKVDIDTEMSMGSNSLNGQVKAIPLTMDQTPYRKDERARVIEYGAEIRSIDGKKKDDWGDFVHNETINVEGDPPRIWFHGKQFPGCAFTRSLGDQAAEEIGVTADPEIISRNLTLNDEYLVIASDGIFEFLTNQYVMDICVTSSTPLEACELLTRAAYDQWLVHENRTDDITVIVCFLSSDYKPTIEEEADTTESLV